MLFLLAALADLTLFGLHVLAVYIGAPAYLYLRAGTRMADAARAGEKWPGLLTLGVASVFLVWGCIAFWASTANPYADWARFLVILIGAVFVLRGAVIVFQLAGMTNFSNGEPPQMRDFMFSTLSLSIGCLHFAALFLSGA